MSSRFFISHARILKNYHNNRIFWINCPRLCPNSLRTHTMLLMRDPISNSESPSCIIESRLSHMIQSEKKTLLTGPIRPALKCSRFRECNTAGGVSRLRVEPGWSWSGCIKPHVGGDSCQAGHVGMILKGTIRVRRDDGTEVVIQAGEAYSIAPGHDAWV